MGHHQTNREGANILAVIDFGGVKQTVITRKEFSLSKARQVLKKETIAIIGYSVKGPAQALNLRDNGFNVIIGQSKEVHERTGTAPSGTALFREIHCLKSRKPCSAAL